MAVENRRNVSAASARAHTRRQMRSSSSSSSSSSCLSGMLAKISIVLSIAIVGLSYQAIQPSPPSICGSPNGPPVTSSRIKLKDGRHLAYMEFGVPKEKANYHIIFIHGFDCCKYDVLPISQELIEEWGVYVLYFDRPGYGESDPNPKRTEKSIPMDIEELADQLGLKSKFYVIGYSMGGSITWGCLKYIPHRLAGAAFLAPVANYWWPGFPSNISKHGYSQQLVQDQWAVRVAHHVPWLTYWWNTQKWFPSSSVASHHPDILSIHDKKLLPKLASRAQYMAQVRQQGEFESLHRDMMVGFGKWEFDPLDLENPFPEGDGSVHLWHGADDLIVPVTMSRYIAQKLSWIRYHELPESGHMFPFADGRSDIVLRSLLLRDS